MLIHAVYFDGKQARRHEVTVELLADSLVVNLDSDPPQSYSRDETDVVPAIGGAERVVRLADGGMLRFEDNDSFRLWEDRRPLRQGERLVARMERRWAAVVAAVVAVALVAVFFFQIALPWLAKDVAFRLPPQARVHVTREALRFIDGKILKPSKLDEETKTSLHELFDSIPLVRSEAYNYRLAIRSGLASPNAFALPDGLIFVTDELVDLIGIGDQMLAVLLHEIGHVEHQHGMRMGLQASTLALLGTLFLGDISGVSSVAAALPGMLTSHAYSRGFEIEADLFAAEYLMDHDYGIEPLVDVFIKMESIHGGIPLEDVLSTHPSMRKRVDILRDFDRRQEADP